MGTIRQTVTSTQELGVLAEIGALMNNSLSFWTEGPKRLREALSKRRSQIDTLASRIRSAPSAKERAEIEEELREMLDEYHPSEEEMKDCIFLLR